MLEKEICRESWAGDAHDHKGQASAFGLSLGRRKKIKTDEFIIFNQQFTKAQKMKTKRIEEIISEHEVRDSSLRSMFRARNIDFREPRIIECHFWTWDQDDAVQLAEGLKARGFEVLVQRPAEIAGDPTRWNLAAAIRQSIDLTMAREFIDDLVRLADSRRGLYDGWGTSV